MDSFDLASGESAKRFAPVKTYDAERLPMADNSVDVVFSSNVLEHIICLNQTLQEILRVLKPDGTAVHILPTPVWRFWTTVGRYVELARRVSLGARNDEPGTSHQSLGRRAGPADLIKRALPLMAHGVYPNAASELYYFSRQRWLRVFRSAGFQLVSTGPAGIFYTGYENLPRLSTRARRRLAAVLGSSCTVFVMRPAR